jgi:hypothetical protein
MSDPRPDQTPDTTEPDGTPVENPSGSAAVDNSGGIAANEVDPDLALIDPTGGEGM